MELVVLYSSSCKQENVSRFYGIVKQLVQKKTVGVEFQHLFIKSTIVKTKIETNC